MKSARSMIKVRSVEQYRARVENVAAANGLRVVVDRTVLRPRLEHGRWLVDCPNCGAGIAVEPDWPEVGCLDVECCHWFTNIEIPSDRHEIEQVLNERSNRINKNWRPGETVETLREENEKHRRAPEGLDAVLLDEGMKP